jgi:excisionase family DNA binding protein
MPDEFPPILDTAGAAELLSMNVDVVRRMARDGELPAYRLPGARAFRFFRDELIEYVRSFPVHPTVDEDEPVDAES